MEELEARGLTSRELEVLRLLGEGRSNREIGEALFISAKTASVHVTHILQKLNVTTRVQAAVAAHRLTQPPTSPTQLRFPQRIWCGSAPNPCGNGLWQERIRQAIRHRPMWGGCLRAHRGRTVRHTERATSDTEEPDEPLPAPPTPRCGVSASSPSPARSPAQAAWSPCSASAARSMPSTTRRPSSSRLYPMTSTSAI